MSVIATSALSGCDRRRSDTPLSARGAPAAPHPTASPRRGVGQSDTQGLDDKGTNRPASTANLRDTSWNDGSLICCAAMHRRRGHVRRPCRGRRPKLPRRIGSSRRADQPDEQSSVPSTARRLGLPTAPSPRPARSSRRPAGIQRMDVESADRRSRAARTLPRRATLTNGVTSITPIRSVGRPDLLNTLYLAERKSAQTGTAPPSRAYSHGP